MGLVFIERSFTVNGNKKVAGNWLSLGSSALAADPVCAAGVFWPDALVSFSCQLNPPLVSEDRLAQLSRLVNVFGI